MFFVSQGRSHATTSLPVPAFENPAFGVRTSATHNPTPSLQSWPVVDTKVDTYTGSSETELLSKLTEHLPSVGPPKTSTTTGDDETTGDAQSGTGSDKKGEKKEKLNGADSDALGAAEALIDAFDKNVDVTRLLRDIRHHAATARRGSRPTAAPPLPPVDMAINAAGLGSIGSPVTTTVADVTQLGDKSRGVMGGGSDPSPSVSATIKPAAGSSRRRREEVEAEAAQQGASGG